MHPAISTIHLHRVFKRGGSLVTALEDVTLQMGGGKVYGLLGPNGAGKTTLIRILTTLLLPTSGEAYVDGYNVVEEPSKVREIINLVSGEGRAGYGLLTVRENLWYYTQLYGLGWREGWRRVDELIETFGMNEYADIKLNKLSHGMIQKYNLARGLINDPKILFLDEPTLGLDVENARDIRSMIKSWVKEGGRTVLLTTHYMAEAEELCNHIYIINKGKIIADGTPQDLKSMVSKEKVFRIEILGIHRNIVEEIRRLEGIISAIEKGDIVKGFTSLRLVVSEEDTVSSVVSFLSKRGLKVSLVVRDEPTLEDVFLKLVGRGL